jgi:hypothetical protein
LENFCPVGRRSGPKRALWIAPRPQSIARLHDRLPGRDTPGEVLESVPEDSGPVPVSEALIMSGQLP